AADGAFTGDFEPGGVDNKGHVIFTSDQGKPDAAHDLGQAVFLTDDNGGKSFRTLSLPGTPAPGGGTFSGAGRRSLSPDPISDTGQSAASASTLAPTPNLSTPGVYRFNRSTGKLTAVETPGVTRATDGTRILGTSFNPSVNNRGDVAFVGVIDTRKGTHP